MKKSDMCFWIGEIMLWSLIAQIFISDVLNLAPIVRWATYLFLLIGGIIIAVPLNHYVRKIEKREKK